jgi:fructokinase
MKQQVAVIGEGVIDRFFDAEGSRDVIGGSPLNTAVALRRAGVEATWWAKIANTAEGTAILGYAQNNGVAGEGAETIDAPAAIVGIHLNAEGVPSYDFALENAADWQWQPEDFAGLVGYAAVQVGSLTSVIEPGAGHIYKALQNLRTTTNRPLISYDPNIRPKAADSAEAASRIRSYVQKLLTVADVVKVSDEDLEWLDPNQAPSVTARQWSQTPGIQIVVMTRGAHGAAAFVNGELAAEVSGVKVEVIDTVGAGDTFMAWLLMQILETGQVPTDPAALASVLTLSAKAAAVTCSRAGCNPPLRHEVK